MKEREFTAEMLNKLTEAVKAVEGTGEYSKYNMELSFKSYQTGRYNFSTYSIPPHHRYNQDLQRRDVHLHR